MNALVLKQFGQKDIKSPFYAGISEKSQKHSTQQ